MTAPARNCRATSCGATSRARSKPAVMTPGSGERPGSGSMPQTPGTRSRPRRGGERRGAKSPRHLEAHLVPPGEGRSQGHSRIRRRAHPHVQSRPAPASPLFRPRGIFRTPFSAPRCARPAIPLTPSRRAGSSQASPARRERRTASSPGQPASPPRPINPASTRPEFHEPRIMPPQAWRIGEPIRARIGA
jgi:hypothetical protein